MPVFNTGHLCAKLEGRVDNDLSASARDSAEQVFDGCDQVADVGLVDVGVCAGRGGRLVVTGIGVAGINYDERFRVESPDGAAELETVPVGQAVVHHVEIELPGLRERFPCGGRAIRQVALLAEQEGDQVAGVGMVFDEQDALGRANGGMPPCPLDIVTWMRTESFYRPTRGGLLKQGGNCGLALRVDCGAAPRG
jgi:hypothetical protein